MSRVTHGGMGVAAVAALPLLAACFDVTEAAEQTALAWPRVRVIDDFESTSLFPTWEPFYRWRAESWPAESTVWAGPTTGFDGEGRCAKYEFEHSAGGGGLLESRVEGAPLDFSSFEELAFTAQLTASRNSGVLMRVSLQCSTATDPGFGQYGEPVGIFSAVSLVRNASPARFVLDLRAFTPYEFQVDEGIEVAPATCLTLVDGIRFEFQNDEDESVGGTVLLDDVELYDREATDAIRVSPWAVDASSRVPLEGPTLTYALSPDADEATVCTDFMQVDRQRSVEAIGVLDLTRYQRLRFRARSLSEPSPGGTEPRFWASVGCRDAAPIGVADPSLRREFEVAPAWSSYALLLPAFEPAPWAAGLGDAEACLRNTQQLCFGASVAAQQSAAGTLKVIDLALE